MRVAPVLNLAATRLRAGEGRMASGKINERLFRAIQHAFSRYGRECLPLSALASRAAAVFDTGADCSEMVRFASRHKLNVQLILLTHAHPDHVDLPRLREETGGRFGPAREPVPARCPSTKESTFTSGIWRLIRD